MSSPYSFCWNELEGRIEGCRKCPRLVHCRENAPKRKSFEKEEYWRRPVKGFGDRDAKLLVIGLAPAAHGANRTGRIFTGDESAKFLIKSLHRAGFANQSTSLSKNDGLKLKDCFMTAAVKCLPPKNRPTAEEFANCSVYFENEILLLTEVKAVLALGKEAFETYLRFLKKEAHLPPPYPHFSHGIKWEMKGWPTLFGSYHPSPQNTYTKKLTEKMMVDLLKQIRTTT